MKKIIAFIRIDNMVDIITNSSSELFVIENTMAKSLLVEIVNKALEGTKHKINEFCVDGRFKKDEAEYETYVDNILEYFPETDREMLREKYFTDPRYYSIAFDRDYMEDSVREILRNLGFEVYTD
jgi:hypothetical protein